MHHAPRWSQSRSKDGTKRPLYYQPQDFLFSFRFAIQIHYDVLACVLRTGFFFFCVNLEPSRSIAPCRALRWVFRTRVVVLRAPSAFVPPTPPKPCRGTPIAIPSPDSPARERCFGRRLSMGLIYRCKYCEFDIDDLTRTYTKSKTCTRRDGR